MVWVLLVDCSSALVTLEAGVVGRGGWPFLITQGKATLPGEKGTDFRRGGCWWRTEVTKELLWMYVYSVNPFLSPLHMNNKNPLWQLSNSPRQCVWLCIVCVCVCVCQGLSRMFGLGSLVTELTFWRNERVVSCCQNATKERIFYKKEEPLLHFCVLVSELVKPQ